MSAEARYERLLRLYPRAHRDEYGPEMLATLMESSTAERRHPEWRESLELILGGLRARAGRPTPASVLRLAVLLLLLAHATALLGARAGRIVFSEVLQGRGLTLPSDVGYVTGFAAAALALVLVAAGRYWLGALFMVAAQGSQQWADSWILWMAQATGGEFWQLPLALLLVLPLLVLRPAACRRPWLWLASIPLALALLPTAFDASLGLQPYALLAVAVGCLVWSVVDARAGIAGGALMLVQLLSLVSFYLMVDWSIDASWNMAAVLTYGGSAVVLFGAGAVLMGRARRT